MTASYVFLITREAIQGFCYEYVKLTIHCCAEQGLNARAHE